MARTQRDKNLSFAAMVVGGACVVLVAGVLISVLRSPAVPRPRGLITVVEQVAPETTHPPQDSRDDARIPSAAEPVPQAHVASAPPPAADSGAAAPAATASQPVVDISTVPLKSSTSGPGNSATKAQGQHGLVILQISDSHTAADYFTGELRQKLQARYGNGGVGYLDAGKPHIGVRSGAMKITASPGWTSHAIQRSDNIAEFWLSGFNAVATASGEVLTFASDSPGPFNSIKIEALRQPGGGSIDISLDGAVKSSADLNGTSVEPVVLRLRPDGAPSDRVRQIEIRSRGTGVVSIASIGIYQKQAGVSYNNIGYPGATIDLVNKFDEKLMADGLRRLDPQIVVLVFGTNEASKPNLDAARYERNYEKAIAENRRRCRTRRSCWSAHPTAPSGRRIVWAKVQSTPPAIRRRRATAPCTRSRRIATGTPSRISIWCATSNARSPTATVLSIGTGRRSIPTSAPRTSWSQLRRR